MKIGDLNLLTLYSTDNDFSRFPNLKWRNPVVISLPNGNGEF